ncbi:MAG TPA: HAMP domain-containing protein [Chloroflexi bacterium]|nr:HAMP domain-containing protein [Chloroflexota bacterium]
MKRLRKQGWWRGLGFLSISWAIFPLTLMLILAIGATGVALLATAISGAETRNLTLAHLSAAQMNDSLTRHARLLTLLAEQLSYPDADANLVFQTYAPLLSDTSTSLSAGASTLLSTSFAGGDLLALDANGFVTAASPSRSALIGQNFAAHPYFQRLHLSTNKTPVFFDVLVEPETGRQIIGAALPIVNQVSNFSGVLFSRIYLDEAPFGSAVQWLAPEAGWDSYLVDGQGQVIFHPDEQLVGLDFSAQPAVNSLRQSGQAGAYLLRASGIPQEFVAYAPVGSGEWGVVITEAWSQVIKPVENALLFITGVLIVGLLALILLTLWAIRRITQPLNRLVVQARQAATGAYDSQVDLSRIREIRELGQAFNHLVAQISSYRTGLQEYVASVTDSQEDERKRIARDLHDGTIQSLIAIGQRIELTRDALAEQPLTQSRQQLTEIKAMVTEAIANIRQFSRHLRPLTLEDLGLIPALHHLAMHLNQEDDVSAELHIEGDAIGLSQDLEVAIFRLVQEALNNIRKHAHATQVDITVRFLSRQTILEVGDNGIGFEVPQNTTDLATKGSFGLLGLEERAALFGGDISIQSAIGQGTIIRVILPHKQIPRRRENRAE